MSRFQPALVLAVAWLSVAPGSPAAIEVGPELILPGSSLARVLAPYGNGPESPGRVSAALCGRSYLVVWGGADGAAYATRVSLSGDVLDDPPLLIAEDGLSPSVASNGETCLVVWGTNGWRLPGAPEIPTQILARRFLLDGTALDAAPIVVETGAIFMPYGVTLGEPQVCVNGQEYLVTYHHLGYEEVWIEGRTLTGDGLIGGERVGVAGLYSTDSYRQCWSCTSGGGRYLVAAPFTAGYWGGINNSPDVRTYVGESVVSFLAWNTGSVTDHTSAASDGTSALVLLNTARDWSWYPDVPEHPPGLRAARVDLAGEVPPYFAAPDDPGLPGTTLIDPQSYITGGVESALAFDGRRFVAVWAAPAGAPSTVNGMLLPAVEDGLPLVKEALFPAEATVPVLATSGKGTSLLLYASPSPSDPTVHEVRGRVVLTDETPPIVAVPASIAATATSTAGAVVTFQATAQDDLSGALTPTCLPASGSVFPPGKTRVTCMAVDAAGNAGFAALDVAVSYSWSGFLPPIAQDGSSVFKVGSRIPVKFRLTGASSGISNLTARLLVSRSSGSQAGVERPATCRSAGASGNLFRYDPASRQYILNLEPRSGTWKLRVDMGDGVERSVLVSLKRKPPKGH